MKELFYLTAHSTHFILQFCGVGDMVKNLSDSERGNLLLPLHGLLFLISSKGSFYAPSHRQDSTYHVALAGTTNISIGQRIDPMTHHIMNECSTIKLHPDPLQKREEITTKDMACMHGYVGVCCD